jgi:hypothetical protein
MSKLYKPLSGKQILKWLPNATLIKYSSLKDMFILPQLPIVLLYEVSPDFGHWVTILKTPQGIEHFDSYGYAPDEELNFVPEKFKYISDQDNKYLLKLLYDSNQKIHYNQYPLQKEFLSATCGRWVILRNLFNDLTTDEFANVINKTSKQLNLTTDELVSTAI